MIDVAKLYQASAISTTPHNINIKQAPQTSEKVMEITVFNDFDKTEVFDTLKSMGLKPICINMEPDKSTWIVMRKVSS